MAYRWTTPTNLDDIRRWALALRSVRVPTPAASPTTPAASPTTPAMATVTGAGSSDASPSAGTEPPGYGGWNREMGALASGAGMVTGGIPGIAMSLAGLGLSQLGRVAPESLTFTPNLAGPYGYGAQSPAEANYVNAVMNAIKEQDPDQYQNIVEGAKMRSAQPVQAISQSIFGGPLKNLTMQDLATLVAAYPGIAAPTWQPSGSPYQGVNVPQPFTGWGPAGPPEGTMTIGPNQTPVYGPNPPYAMPTYDPFGLREPAPPSLEDPFGPGRQEAQDLGAAMGVDLSGFASQPSPEAQATGDPTADLGGRDQDVGGFGTGSGTGEPGEWARGGVSRVRRPTRALYGEGGEPETAIFIPKGMEAPGLQGREADVIAELQRQLRKLSLADVRMIVNSMRL